jgi:hypothetical protein
MERHLGIEKAEKFNHYQGVGRPILYMEFFLKKCCLKGEFLVFG